MKIDSSLLKRVFLTKNKNTLRCIFNIDKEEDIVFVWIPNYNLKTLNDKMFNTFCHFKKISKKYGRKRRLEGIVATNKAIYFPQDTTVCMNNEKKYLFSDISEISFDSYYFTIKLNGFSGITKIPCSYFHYYDSNIKNFDNGNEIMAFITGVLNMLLKTIK